MKPLTDSEIGSVAGKQAGGALRRAVLAHQAHVEMPVVRRALGLLVTRRRRPGLRQIEQAVPVDTRRPIDQEFGGALEAEFLHLLGAEARGATFRDPDRQVGDGFYL